MKPMLGTSINRTDLIAQLEKGPLLASFKLDGVRALIKDGKVLSRSLKLIPNKHVQQWLSYPPEQLQGLDGELIVGEPNVPEVFRKTTSGVMSPEGEPDFKFHVFDLWDEMKTPFHNRVALVKSKCFAMDHVIVPVAQTKVYTIEEADAFMEDALALGYEGVVLRDPYALYKYGRSTVREAGLLKLKPFVDAEAVVIAKVEQMHNANEAFTNELGRTSRSSAKAGKQKMGVLGALVCRTPEGVEFEIGTGFSAVEREAYWLDTGVVGRTVKYKYLVVGGYDKPRSAVFLGFRDRRDT